MIGEDRSRARVLEAGGAELVERIDVLEAHRRARLAASGAETNVLAPDATLSTDYDVVIVGGGLWSILATGLCERGLRVAVFDRARAGGAHREWNASASELTALVRAGVVTSDELERIIVARYRHGIWRFHGGGSYPVSGVLDCAVDAGALLRHAKHRATSLGAAFFDHHTLAAHAASRAAVRMRFRERDGSEHEVTARVMVDARGASSPYATADLVCPTVGGVIRGLTEGAAHDEIDPNVGEILATVDGVVDGRQHVWEAFPAGGRDTTVYLFYYALASEHVSLWDLYARFFAALPSYKRGLGEFVRPTFGYIPGWSRLSSAPSSPHPRIVLVGDAASRHSSLTYCGFGATLRSLEAAAASVERLVHGDPRTAANIVDDQPIHALTGVLAHMMASRRFHGDELNSLLDAAFGTLHQMGNAEYAALLRDEMRTSSFLDFLRRTATHHPAVWRKTLRGLSPLILGRWALGVAGTAVREAST